MPDPELVERFWSKVDKTGDCWVWKGRPATKEGYCRIGFRGRKILAHRLSFEIANGPIPEGLLVLHRCDNPPCVRPDHLFLGTDLDNHRDMEAKGRMVTLHGEEHGRAKLTQVEVDAIRLAAAAGVLQKDLAARYQVTPQLISQIVRRTIWR